MSNTRPTIAPAPNGPYLVKDLKTLRNSKGDALETQPTVALCRCGQSERKPFCDGTHARVGLRIDGTTMRELRSPYTTIGGSAPMQVVVATGNLRSFD